MTVLDAQRLQGAQQPGNALPIDWCVRRMPRKRLATTTRGSPAGRPRPRARRRAASHARADSCSWSSLGLPVTTSSRAG